MSIREKLGNKIFSHMQIRWLGAALIAVSFTIVSLLAMSGRGWIALGKDIVPPSPVTVVENKHNTAQGASPNPHKGGPIQTVRFALYDAGILPQEARAQKGMVSIVMHNLSGGTEGLILERKTGSAPERVTHVRRGQKFARGKETLELTPGTYQIWDASRPENRATLIIEP